MKKARIEHPTDNKYQKWANTAQKTLTAYGYEVEVVQTHGFPNWEVKGTEDEQNNAGILLSILLDMHELEAMGPNRVYHL